MLKTLFFTTAMFVIATFMSMQPSCDAWTNKIVSFAYYSK